MKLKDFCNATGLSRDTVNFYVRLGLLHPTRLEGESNNYRHFAPSDVEAARSILSAKSLGFTLQEIKKIADDYNRSSWGPERKIALLEAQVERLGQRREALNTLEANLRSKIALLQAQER